MKKRCDASRRQHQREGKRREGRIPKETPNARSAFIGERRSPPHFEVYFAMPNATTRLVVVSDWNSPASKIQYSWLCRAGYSCPASVSPGKRRASARITSTPHSAATTPSAFWKNTKSPTTHPAVASHTQKDSVGRNVCLWLAVPSFCLIPTTLKSTLGLPGQNIGGRGRGDEIRATRHARCG